MKKKKPNKKNVFATKNEKNVDIINIAAKVNIKQ